MKWYTGEIAEAIGEAKSKGAIFVVYIEGDDESSKKFTELFNGEGLGVRLESNNFVAIKVQAGSLPHQQFSEFYKDPSTPSIYFIGKDGNVLDIFKGHDNIENFASRIDDILSKAGITITGIEEKKPNETVVCENGVCRIVKKNETPKIDVGSSSSMQESSDLTAEEKVQRAKELLEEKRIQKESAEKEEERLKEIDRRKMGQSVQELKRWQKEQEMKQILEEREKEKREEKLARERVLAQIKQDREERLSKSQPLSPATENPPKTNAASPSQIKSDKTRLQFKLPDGSSKTQEFSISDTLECVVRYIKENLELPFANFKLSTTFPRREFVSGDHSQTLLDLQLTPNAVILVLPLGGGAVTSTNVGGTLTTLLWSLFSPILGIFEYLKGFIFGRKQNTTGTKRPSDDTEEPRGSNPKRRMMRDSTVVRKQGNVHRLTDRHDSDDEGNTWNGNSTQQM